MVEILIVLTYWLVMAVLLCGVALSIASINIWEAVGFWILFVLVFSYYKKLTN